VPVAQTVPKMSSTPVAKLTSVLIRAHLCFGFRDERSHLFQTPTLLLLMALRLLLLLRLRKNLKHQLRQSVYRPLIVRNFNLNWVSQFHRVIRRAHGLNMWFDVFVSLKATSFGSLERCTAIIYIALLFVMTISFQQPAD